MIPEHAILKLNLDENQQNTMLEEIKKFMKTTCNELNKTVPDSIAIINCNGIALQY